MGIIECAEEVKIIGKGLIFLPIILIEDFYSIQASHKGGSVCIHAYIWHNLAHVQSVP